ncbi:unnamed protein product [Sphagnum balticum]
MFDDSERHEAATRLAVSKYTDEQRECLMTVSRVRPVKRSPAHRSSRTGRPTLITASSSGAVCVYGLVKGSELDPWADFANAVMFTFTVITTIGYGHVAPTTWQGDLVCCVYGLVAYRWL